MRITEIIKGERPSLSFEVFPPKTTVNFDNVMKATGEIAKLQPDFMSVTYGAGGGTSQYTLDIAKDIMKTCGVPTLAHLTCVSSTRETVREQIAAIREAGIGNVMALRGDLTPELEGADRSNWPYRYAVDLVRELKESGADFCIGGACYPEVHPESAHQKEDIRYLKEKVDAGVEVLTTQMFFDNNLLYNFLYKIREAGITVPIVAGVMPITNAQYACIPEGEEVKTIGVTATFVVSNDLSEEDVYNMTKALWENIDAIAQGHVIAKSMDINAATITIGNVPVHPGAAKYYAEVSGQ